MVSLDVMTLWHVAFYMQINLIMESLGVIMYAAIMMYLYKICLQTLHHAKMSSFIVPSHPPTG